jgi:putative NADH-flavin reductase
VRLALFGATGHMGSAILHEALARGHQVTAIGRHPEGLPSHPNLVPRKGDVTDEAATTAQIAGHDALISAYNPDRNVPDMYEQHLSAYRAILRSARLAGVKRVLVVGGVGSLEVASGVLFLDTPAFPEAWKTGGRANRDVLALLRAQSDLEWTCLSPPAMSESGERTGRFRLGGDQVLTDADGRSWISAEDYAVAMLDEVEQPRHVRQRFTVGY